MSNIKQVLKMNPSNADKGSTTALSGQLIFAGGVAFSKTINAAGVVVPALFVSILILLNCSNWLQSAAIFVLVRASVSVVVNAKALY